MANTEQVLVKIFVVYILIEEINNTYLVGIGILLSLPPLPWLASDLFPETLVHTMAY
jgi:hypothetical protein